jgi:MFS superfamily sulfate permease-like transporter
VNVAQTTKQKAGGRWRLPLFQSLLPIDRSGLAANLAAGISLAAMNIPQAMGYAKIAGMPVMTGLYTLLLPLVAFAALGSSRYLVVASDSATAAILAGGLSALATAGSAHYVSLAGLVALLTAGFLLLARLLKLGFLADFLSRTVLIGFLTGVGFQVGIAVLSDMLKLDENRDLLGISAANAAAALSGTFVVNGSPTQTAMVETSGGSSQLAHLSRAWRFRHRSAQRSKTQWR